MLTDPKHADKVRLAGHAAWEKLLDTWLKEYADANAPSSGPAVTVGGGQPSDPVSVIATDTDRERHANWIGTRVTQLLDAMQQEVQRFTPKKAEDVGMCVNCNTMPGVEAGRCPKCGPFFRKHGRDPKPEVIAKAWNETLDTRPCRICGNPIKIADGRTHVACRKQKSRANNT